MRLSRRFARRAEVITASETLAISALAERLKREGRDIIALSAGEPDFDTPAHIKEAAIRAVREGYTKYTPATGSVELREAIARKLNRENGLEYSPANIVVTCGGKHAILNAVLALCEEGDKVLTPSPCWVTYPEQVKLAGARPVLLTTTEEQGFKITPRQLKAALSPKTKVLILNSPCNPTGAVYTKEELAALAEVIESSGLYVISDEIYEKIVYDGHGYASLAQFNSIRDRVVVVNGVSKAYAMTGWRIGYLAAAGDIVERVSRIQSHSTSNATSISQKAAVAALDGPPESIETMVRAFDERRKYVYERVRQIPGMKCMLPQGAFYLFPKVSALYGLRGTQGAIRDSNSLCQFLLETEGLALVPGVAFGSDDHLRISYAASMETFVKGMDRLERAVLRLYRRGTG